MTSYVSFLSDKVKAILECAGTDQDIHEGLPLYTHNEQGLPIFNLNLIRKDLDSLPASRDHEFYLQMSKYFSQIFHCCQKSIGSLDPSKLDFDGFTWISSRRFFRGSKLSFYKRLYSNSFSFCGIFFRRGRGFCLWIGFTV